VSKIIDFKFKMLTLERSTQMRKHKARADPSSAREEGQERVGKSTDCSGNGGRSNFDAFEIQRKK